MSKEFRIWTVDFWIKADSKEQALQKYLECFKSSIKNDPYCMFEVDETSICHKCKGKISNFFCEQCGIDWAKEEREMKEMRE